MEVRMGSKSGLVVASVAQVVAAISEELQQRPTGWLQALQQDPARLGELEQEVHQTFRGMADRVLAGLLGQASRASAALDAAKKA